MGIRFIIDSASDVLPQEAAAMGVTLLPMKVIFGSQEYADGVELSHAAFFEKLKDCAQLPTTCQIPPADFSQACAAWVGRGEQVVILTISSELSGTYQSAVIAASDHPGQVFVVDSRSAAVGERILLQWGLQLTEQGLSAEDIAQKLRQAAERLRVVAVLDTLEYLKKGGRISAATALAGGLLGIKPLVQIRQGRVCLAGTARGIKKAHQLLRQLVEQQGQLDRQMPMALTYGGDKTGVEQLVQSQQSLWEGSPPPIYSLGCTIGTHVGPGAFGLAYFEKI